MELTLHTLAIDEAAIAGNVELKVAAGTLPQRLTIEKIYKTLVTEQAYNLNAVSEIKIVPNQNFAIVSISEGAIFGKYTLVDLTDVSVDVMSNIPSLLYMVHKGISGNHVYYTESEYGSLARLDTSDYSKINVATGETAYNQRACLCSDGYIYVLMRLGIIKKYDLSLNYIESLSPTGKTDSWGQMVSLDGEEFILNNGEGKIQKWIKSTDTLTTLFQVSSNLSVGGYFSRVNNYLAFVGTYEINGEKKYAIMNQHGLLEFDSAGENRKVIIFPIKIGQYLMSPIIPFGSMSSHKGYDYDGRWMIFMNGSRPMNRVILAAVDFRYNDFASSYAQWTISGLTGTLKKIIINGGFAKGYGDNYADAKQIKVEYNDGSWHEYDIDASADIDVDVATITAIRIGLQERATFSDRLPYISKATLLIDSTDITPPATPGGLTVDEPPAKPSGVGIEAL